MLPAVGRLLSISLAFIHRKVDRQEATGGATERGGGCGDEYCLAKHSAMHGFGKFYLMHFPHKSKGYSIKLFFFRCC